MRISPGASGSIAAAASARRHTPTRCVPAEELIENGTVLRPSSATVPGCIQRSQRPVATVPHDAPRLKRKSTFPFGRITSLRPAPSELGAEIERAEKKCWTYAWSGSPGSGT